MDESGLERGVLKGALLALLSAFTYATSLVLSATAFEHGMAPLTMTIMRFLAVAIFLGAYLLVTRGFVPILTLPGRHAIGVGAFHFSGNLMMMIAVAVAPVSISIVLFYTFPAIVLLMSSLLDRKMPDGIEIITIFIAIAGVALTVYSGDAGGPINMFGAGLALAAAVAVSMMMTGTQRLLAGQNSVGVTFNLAITSVALGVVASLVSGSFAMPQSAEGYWMLLAVMLLYPIALTCAVLAIGLAGAVTVALILCIEPVLTIVLAVGFRGETLTPRQICGVVLVISAIVFLQWQRSRRAR